MSKKEMLKSHIEEERRKLNQMIERSGKLEEAYCQSLVVDRLIEQYMLLVSE